MQHGLNDLGEPGIIAQLFALKEQADLKAYRARRAARETYCPNCPITGECIVCKASHSEPEPYK